MKNLTKAFTMLELIMVIVVVGIISALAIPRADRDNLREAADQVVSHIQYAQKLAMQDDKFSLTDNRWFARRWQIMFSRQIAGVKEITYTVFSDTAGAATGNPDLAEMARDPQNPSKVLSAGFAGTLATNAPEANEKLNLTKKFSIRSINFAGGCDGRSTRISFDYLGRPMTGDISGLTQPYDIKFLIQQDCNITLTDDRGENMSIIISPETGYTRIDSSDD